MADMVQVRRASVNQFAQEPQARIGRSQFDRSHGVKTTFDASYLIPFYVDEVLPGDTFTMSLNGFARIFSPLDAPIMDNIELETFFFYVPCRLLWENWAYFMGEHDVKGAQDTVYTVPILANGFTADHDAAPGSGLLMAYMGLPDGLASTDVDVNGLPFRAYRMIWNHWFRDQNLIDEVSELTANGPDNVPDMYKTAKKHDYFTSCLPYLQKGSASKILGAITTLDVETLAVQGNEVTIDSGSGERDLDSAGPNVIVDTVSTGSPMFVDVSGLSVDVNTLRQSIAVQRLLEKDARGGTRYVELLKSHFGVTSPDYRLQNPEYLGGGRSFVNVTPVANTTSINAATSASGADVDQGELRGIGTGVISGHSWAKSFTEHGYILGLVRARGDVTYWQGIEKMYSRSTRYDFFFPDLANLGEQTVLNKEIYVQNAGADDNPFGYQERWNEYRSKQSRLSGMFNPDTAGSLSFWHLAEDFAALPGLNQTFVEDATPMDRVTTVDTGHQFIMDVWLNLKCARPMPLHSMPSLTGGRF